MFKYIAKLLIIGYKKTLSRVVGNSCAYTPTCSMYTYDAISKYGAFAGILMGAKRIISCHPRAKGGFHPVKENFKGQAKWVL
ncbi:MAG: membrane protein insertion efficiency factor YidD [Firmicutes bacterium]|nr:membrane protein insertion efficiency factor YidD [Bacillota bacterium]